MKLKEYLEVLNTRLNTMPTYKPDSMEDLDNRIREYCSGVDDIENIIRIGIGVNFIVLENGFKDIPLFDIGRSKNKNGDFVYSFMPHESLTEEDLNLELSQLPGHFEELKRVAFLEHHRKEIAELEDEVKEYKEKTSKLEQDIKYHRKEILRLEGKENIVIRGEIYTLKSKLFIKSTRDTENVEKVIIVKNRYFDNYDNIVTIGLDKENNFTGGLQIISKELLDKNTGQYDNDFDINEYVTLNLRI